MVFINKISVPPSLSLEQKTNSFHFLRHRSLPILFLLKFLIIPLFSNSYSQCYYQLLFRYDLWNNLRISVTHKLINSNTVDKIFTSLFCPYIFISLRSFYINISYSAFLLSMILKVCSHGFKFLDTLTITY